MWAPRASHSVVMWLLHVVSTARELQGSQDFLKSVLGSQGTHPERESQAIAISPVGDLARKVPGIASALGSVWEQSEAPSRIFQKSQTHADTLILSDFIFKNQSHFIITALDPENSTMSYLSQYPKKWSQCLSPEGLSAHTY